MSHSGNSYIERVSTAKSDGEALFEKYCNVFDTKFQRLGFDEKNDNVPKFWRINPILRNLPDYLITNSFGKTYVVAVKGTENFKQKEFELLPKMVEAFSSKEAPLIYAFCFKEKQAPIWVKPHKIIELYKNAVDQQWHDGVIYRNLNIRNMHERLQLAILDPKKALRTVLFCDDFAG
jgi:hypothetical protein